MRGTDQFWPSLIASQNGKLGAAVEAKSQYLEMLHETLSIASNIRHWVIAHVDSGLLTTHELVETIGKIRRVEAVYTKDFTELVGVKAVMITA